MLAEHIGSFVCDLLFRTLPVVASVSSKSLCGSFANSVLQLLVSLTKTSPPVEPMDLSFYASFLPSVTICSMNRSNESAVEMSVGGGKDITFSKCLSSPSRYGGWR